MLKVKPKILIVNDEVNDGRIYERLLEPLEIEVHKVNSGSMALKSVYAHDYFLVLVDMKTPKKYGLDAVSLILNNEKTENMPVIFIAVLGKSNELKLNAYAAGAVDYIVKPVVDDILLAKVKTFLNPSFPYSLLSA